MNSKRYARIRQVIAMRQPDLTVCLENVHKPHNISAVIRTADAVGIPQIHAIWCKNNSKSLSAAAAGSNHWVKVKTHATIENAISTCKAAGMQILAAHLTNQAIDFRQIDYTRPTCIILGQERAGISKQALALADHNIHIPMMGMVQSLNISVASALILYEAQRQRQNANMYDGLFSQLSEEEQQAWLFEGGYPVLAAVSKHKGLPRPLINEHGEIVASDAWWAAMQSSKVPGKKRTLEN
ncbi:MULTISPECIES: tRNA (guanosine(18)-2'-O)-methyltransferase TrmH [unclassified Arsenophonus]|uniref:tRNA (guanosine(18)-2'-O)-methyltransferase TrmH n=1 Tax=unclassified Arsenophonus TaxID=2627083 RepID=UPI0028667644|nr:tRNA (guanosine(18)-2'-O)-methyltransferase TrmH [Arsenophonus sp.]MDR5609743.1 tRNA (guanosine(18)-2'-O)-methyltransferase TrmH [Arsenophonus sp.]MDR5613477.1 tRNA (guanosine(18)-2'-O)-methyltransferase TrmH [Arsenophonus sp.]